MGEIYPLHVPSPHELWDIVVKMKTNTPGAGTLLTTVRYNDGEGDQDLNVSLNLTAGAYAVAAWPCIWFDSAHPVSLAYTFLSAGGTADVEILARNV